MRERQIACVIAMCVAGLVAFGVAAKDKPDGPPGQNKAECIVFDGDLASAGETHIVGCCPNAGPSPQYEMTLTTGWTEIDGTYSGDDSGYLFISVFGTGPDQTYMTKFWTWDSYGGETPGDGDFFIEIRNGVIVRDRKAKTETVTYDNMTADAWIYSDVGEPVHVNVPGVSFTLFRTGNLELCPEPSS